MGHEHNHGHSHGHSHSHGSGANEKSLKIALLLTGFFMFAEIIGGLMTNSLALLSDAAHMFTDAAALAIALAAIRIGRRPADQERTFGYYRFEILAAAFNAVLLFMVAMYILYEAYRRLENPPEIASSAMFVIAALGLVMNLVSMKVLSGGKDSSLNVKGAYLEVWSDMLGSLGVMVGAVVIYFTQWSWVDSAIAVGIGLWVLPRTWVLLKQSLNVLLEGVPEGMNLAEVEAAITNIAGVASIHDLHIWALSSNKVSATVHVVVQAPDPDWQALLGDIRETLETDFDIHHSTIQMERVPCGQSETGHCFGPDERTH